jgi:prevent-host-death family protein
MKEATLPASEFKAKCLRILDEIAAEGSSLTITKHGRPIARLVPIAKPINRLRGSWKSIVRTHGDGAHFSVSDGWESNR